MAAGEGGDALRVVVLDEIDSTNEEAFRRHAAGESGRLWVRARRQTAGRGRSGRSWVSPDGNLHVSLLLTEPLAPAERPRVGFVAGLALVEALEIVAEAAGPFRLKWPNDVLADGRKVAGLLLEARGPDALVVGWGVDVAGAPDGTETPATSLAARGAITTAEALHVELAIAFAGWWRVFDGGRGFPDIREAWKRWAHGIGGPLRVRHDGGWRHGTFVGLDAEGRLVLRETEGPVFTMTAGDVFFPESRS
jgi:BirA family transcriptional regulator, biotin operon repressor / biotin---[acetyl-CoA-carboxylase] ligase